MKRRQLLRSTAAIGAGLAVAGCTDAANAALGGSDPESESRTVTGEDLQQWLYAPGAVRDRDHYQYYFLAPSSVEDAREPLSEETFDRLQRAETTGILGFQGGFKQLTNIDFWDVDGFLHMPPAWVLLGAFGRSDVERRLAYNDLSYQGDYDGFELYSGDDGPTVAVEGVEGEDGPPETASSIVIGEPVISSTGETTVGGDDVARTVVDTYTGSEDRYSDEVDAMATLTDQLGTGTLSSGRTYEPVGETGRANVDVDGESITYGQTVQGDISSDDTVEIEGMEYDFFDSYGFEGAEGESISITVSSDQQTPFFALIDDAGRVFMTSFENRTETDSGAIRMEDVELPADGTYEIHVSTEELLQAQSQSLDEPIPYTLTLEVDPATTDGPAAGVFEGEVGRGNVAEIEGEETVRRIELLFEEAVPTDDIETWISENEEEGAFADYGEVSLEASDGVATIETTIETEEFTPTF